MFKKIYVNKGYVYLANVTEELVDCSNWACETAFAKADHTFDSWQIRKNKFAKFVDIYYGDFAKNIVKLFLLNKNPQLNIEEYDLIRTDGFKKHDLFDLRLCKREIEVKSSLEKYTNVLSEIYSDRRIIVNVNGPHQTLSDYVVQVFFVPDNLNHYIEIEKSNAFNSQLSDTDIEKNCSAEANYSIYNTKIYIMGWINKTQEQKAIQQAQQPKSGFGVSNQNSNAKKRTYANVMIEDSNLLDELVNDLTRIQQKDEF